MPESSFNPSGFRYRTIIAGALLPLAGLVSACSGEATQNEPSQVPVQAETPTVEPSTIILTAGEEKRLIIARATAQNILDVTCGQLGNEFKKGNQEVARTSMSLVYEGAKFILRKAETQPDSSITVTEAVTKSLKNPQPEDCVSASVLKFPTKNAYSDYLSHVKRESIAPLVDPDTIPRKTVKVTSSESGSSYVWTGNPEDQATWNSLDLDTLIQYGLFVEDTSKLGPSTHKIVGIGDYSIDSGQVAGIKVPTRKELNLLESAQNTFYEALSQ